jgi:hypothetical protein
MLLHHAAMTLQALYPHNTESAWQRHKKEKNKRAPGGEGSFNFPQRRSFGNKNTRRRPIYARANVYKRQTVNKIKRKVNKKIKTKNTADPQLLMEETCCV